MGFLENCVFLKILVSLLLNLEGGASHPPAVFNMKFCSVTDLLENQSHGRGSFPGYTLEE